MLTFSSTDAPTTPEEWPSSDHVASSTESDGGEADRDNLPYDGLDRGIHPDFSGVEYIPYGDLR